MRDEMPRNAPCGCRSCHNGAQRDIHLIIYIDLFYTERRPTPYLLRRTSRVNFCCCTSGNNVNSMLLCLINYMLNTCSRNDGSSILVNLNNATMIHHDDSLLIYS